jgi:hypothetical protein
MHIEEIRISIIKEGRKKGKEARENFFRIESVNKNFKMQFTDIQHRR